MCLYTITKTKYGQRCWCFRNKKFSDSSRVREKEK